MKGPAIAKAACNLPNRTLHQQVTDATWRRAVRYTRRMLLCTVRNCHMELVREERRLHCPRGHSFDVARSGYINLLQPQERRSKEPGDTAIARRMRVDRGPARRIARAATLAELRGWAPLAGIQV